MFLEWLIRRQILIFLEPIQEKLFRVDKEESPNENVVLDNKEESIALRKPAKKNWIFYDIVSKGG